MAVDTTLRSRRGMLTGLAGGLGALIAAALGRPAPVAAGAATMYSSALNATDGTPWPYTDVHRTDVTTGAALAGNDYGIHAYSSEAGGTGADGWAFGDSGVGVDAKAFGASGIGVAAYVDGNAGTSVDASTTGHYSQTAVKATAKPQGYGVYAESTSGIAVAAVCDAGYALQVEGRAVFSRSGITAFSVGQASRTVSRTGSAWYLSATSMVVATIQGDVAGTWVRGVSLDRTRQSFTIRLNKAAPASLKVGWFIVN